MKNEEHKAMRLAWSGFALIEVLISIFVLALGVIGAAGMQLTALRVSHQSAFQTAALQLATELADKMRANYVLMQRDDGSNPFLQIDYTAPAEPKAARLCYGARTDCDANALAHSDIYEWEKRIQATLPGGRAVVCRDMNPWNEQTSTFEWPCDASAGAVNAPLVIKMGWQMKNPDGSLTKDTGKQAAPSVVITVEPYIR